MTKHEGVIKASAAMVAGVVYDELAITAIVLTRLSQEMLVGGLQMSMARLTLSQLLIAAEEEDPALKERWDDIAARLSERFEAFNDAHHVEGEEAKQGMALRAKRLMGVRAN